MKSTTRWLAAALLLAGTTAFAARSRTGRQAKREAMQAQAFAQADADGNGSLSPQEFANYRPMRTPHSAYKFTRLDANGDGQVTLDELQAGPSMHQPARQQG